MATSRFLGTVIVALSIQTSVAAAGSADCFRGKLPYFQNFVRLANDNSPPILPMTLRGCSELVDQPLLTEAFSPLERAGAMAMTPIFGVFGQGAGAFSNLNGSAKQRDYKKRLDEIAKEPNPMFRIRRVYELAAATQGHYDFSGNGMKNFARGFAVRSSSPGNLINSSERDGSVGVCREMASLLKWSLQQVSRAPGSRSMGLGPNDFSSTYMTGTVPGAKGWKDSGGHAWVRINMPIHDKGQLLGFSHFDLDTTWYPEQFSPLIPRRSGLSAPGRKKLIDECHRVQACLVQSESGSSSVTVPLAPAKPRTSRSGSVR